MPKRARKRTLNEAMPSIQDHFPRESKRVRLSPKTATSPWQSEQQSLQTAYLLAFPDDFFHCWDWLKSLNPSNPIVGLESVNLQFVGPFEFIEGKLSDLSSESVLAHWRYYHDLPQFLTVCKLDNDDDGLHWGYWYDNPSELPSLIAEAQGDKIAKLKFAGDSILSCVHTFLHDAVQLKRAEEDARKKKKKKKIKVVKRSKKKSQQRDEAILDGVCASLSEIEALLQSLETFGEEKAGMTFTPHKLTQSFKDRKRRVVAKCFHEIGLIVPVVNDVGYRQLNYSDSELHKILNRMQATKNRGGSVQSEEVDFLLGNVCYADDEGDPGMGLELGIDFFCSHPMFQKEAVRLMTNGYNFLNWQPFITILNAHFKRRDRTTWNESLNMDADGEEDEQDMKDCEESGSGVDRENDSGHCEGDVDSSETKVGCESDTDVKALAARVEMMNQQTLDDLSSGSD